MSRAKSGYHDKDTWNFTYCSSSLTNRMIAGIFQDI